MTTQQPDYRKHPLMKELITNEKVIDKLMNALTHLNELQELSKLFTIELDGSYIEEMTYSCNRLLTESLNQRDEILGGLNHV
jgi:hypothetical protein